MVLQDIALYAYQVAAHRHVIRLQIDSDAGGFQHPASLVYRRQVIPHYRHVRHLASRMKPVGYGLQHSGASHACQHIHAGRMGILQ